jgi:hypothetical protein
MEMTGSGTDPVSTLYLQVLQPQTASYFPFCKYRFLMKFLHQPHLEHIVTDAIPTAVAAQEYDLTAKLYGS